MKYIYLALVVFTTILSSWKKNDSTQKIDVPIEITVKVMDVLCSNVILEIQYEPFKKLVNAYF